MVIPPDSLMQFKNYYHINRPPLSNHQIEMDKESANDIIQLDGSPYILVYPYVRKSTTGSAQGNNKGLSKLYIHT